MEQRVKTKVDDIKKKLKELVLKIKEKPITLTKPGAIKFLLWGAQPSQQSISIKMGKKGEELFKHIVNITPKMVLQDCGVQLLVSGKKKDIDLCFEDTEKKILYVMELKGNMELDSEKIVATWKKMVEDFKPHFEKKYTEEWKIKPCILAWSIYEDGDAKKGKSQIKKCKDNNIWVLHFNDFLKMMGIVWEKSDFTKYWIEMGDLLELVPDTSPLPELMINYKKMKVMELKKFCKIEGINMILTKQLIELLSQ